MMVTVPFSHPSHPVLRFINGNNSDAKVDKTHSTSPQLTEATWEAQGRFLQEAAMEHSMPHMAGAMLGCQRLAQSTLRVSTCLGSAHTRASRTMSRRSFDVNHLSHLIPPTILPWH